MNKIDKATQKQFDKLHSELFDAAKEYSDTITKLNETIQEEIGKCDVLRETYNEKLDNLKSFVTDLISEQESYIDEKESNSDKWADSDKGQNYHAWKDSWQELESELENFEADEIDIPEINSDNIIDLEQIMLPDFQP